MVTNSNATDPDIKKLIKQNWNIVSNSTDCGHIFHDIFCGLQKPTKSEWHSY